MSEDYKEGIIRKKSPFCGQHRKFFYSENPQFPKYRLLLDRDKESAAHHLWNALIEFELLINYDQVSKKQRIIKIVMSFHSFASSSFVSGGLERIQEDGIAVRELLDGFKEIGAERQYDIVASYIKVPDDEVDRQYYQYMSDTSRRVGEYVMQNIDDFVKWV
jgi:hypothetical protein